MPDYLSADPYMVKQSVQREQRNYTKCASANVVGYHSSSHSTELIYDQNTALSIGFVATEYCTLAQLVDTALLGEPMPEPTLRYVIKSVISGVKALHS